MNLIVGFSKPRNRTLPIASYIIRAYEKTEFSHVYLKVFIPQAKKHVVYEAVGHGVRFISEEEWLKKARIVKEFSIFITEEQNDLLISDCFDNCGKTYGFLQNLGIVITDTFALAGNPFTKHRNCSEEVAKRVEKVGIIFKKSKNLISPKDLYEYFNENKDL